MGKSYYPDASFEALSKLADDRFNEWCSKEWRPKWDNQLDELSKKKVTGGRFVSALRIAEELLTSKALEQISIYEGVARERQCREMLSKLRLDEFRERIMGTSVGASVGALRGRFQRQVNAVGCPPSAVPHEQRYQHLLSGILRVVNEELGLLEAEGSVDAGREKEGDPSARPLPVLTTGPTPAPTGNKRLPSVIESVIAARRVQAYIETGAVDQTQFAINAGATDRTIRKFRRTGKVRRGIFEGIASAMDLTSEELLKAE